MRMFMHSTYLGDSVLAQVEVTQHGRIQECLAMDVSNAVGGKVEQTEHGQVHEGQGGQGAEQVVVQVQGEQRAEAPKC